uniref:Uncharacterized protein n=1 Tax=Medicago truncatula TaxID=3880 RepID=I3S6L6_MEDTR|nr:unknown [Medicago truncatula]
MIQSQIHLNVCKAYVMAQWNQVTSLLCCHYASNFRHRKYVSLFHLIG